MERPHSLWKRILYFLGVTAVFLPLALIMALLGCHWYGWALFALVVVLLAALAFSKMGGWSKALCLVLLFAASCTVAVYTRPSLQVSFSGTLAREAMLWLAQRPAMKEEVIRLLVDPEADVWQAPEGYTLTRYDLEGLPIEVLHQNGTVGEQVILQLHGGAYQVGLTNRYRDHALRYCQLQGGVDVVTVDYRLAPAFTYPAALEDALAAWEWLLEQGYQADQILLAGDGAGGNLALALTAKLRDAQQELPYGLVLFSPWTDFTASGDSYQQNQAKDPIFCRLPGDDDDYLTQAGLYDYAGGADLEDPYLSPVYGSFEGFPAMLVIAGGDEVMASDASRLVQKAVSQGVEAVSYTHLEKGGPSSLR